VAAPESVWIPLVDEPIGRIVEVVKLAGDGSVQAGGGGRAHAVIVRRHHQRDLPSAQTFRGGKRSRWKNGRREIGLARSWAFDRAVKCGRGVYRVVTEYDPSASFPGDQHIIIKPHYAGGKTDGFYFKVPKARGLEGATDSQVVRFVTSDGGESLFRLEFVGGLYSERQELILSTLSSGPTARKAIAAALKAKYPAWSDLELQRRTTNSLAYLEAKGLVRKVERGIYTLPESSSQKGASQSP
jgi:hypothetical protein